MNYKEQLQDHKWYNKRKEILERDNYKCTNCGTIGNLQVHHKRYIRGRKAWEYDNSILTTLCRTCHEHLHLKESIDKVVDENKINNIKLSLKTKKPEFANGDLGVNPFLSYFKIKTDVRGNGDLIEKESRSYIYTKPEKRKYINNLSAKARLLFLWLLYEVSPDKTYLWININRALNEIDMSLNTLKSALKELSEFNILSPVDEIRNVFWVNPSFFFKGSRLNYFKENVEIGNE